MLYCQQFKDYEDFKSRFGYKENINGERLCNKSGAFQRKHNIVYQYWKESVKNLHDNDNYSLSFAFSHGVKLTSEDEVFADMVFSLFPNTIVRTCNTIFKPFENIILDMQSYCTNDNPYLIPLIIDGKPCKMKIGKYINKLITYYSISNKASFWINNQTLRTFLIERLAEMWKSEVLKNQSLKLVVSKNFNKIYNTDFRLSDESYFNSCMDDKGQYYFYEDHDDIFSAVSLQDEDGNVYARCVLVKCQDDDGKDYTLLDRIYYNKRMYCDLLFNKAKYDNIFNIYKDLDASCHESYRILDMNGKLLGKRLHIQLDLDNDSCISYQDTFKFYIYESGIAYNTDKNLTGYYNLDTTSEYIEFDYIDEDESEDYDE